MNQLEQIDGWDLHAEVAKALVLLERGTKKAQEVDEELVALWVKVLSGRGCDACDIVATALAYMEQNPWWPAISDVGDLAMAIKARRNAASIAYAQVENRNAPSLSAPSPTPDLRAEMRAKFGITDADVAQAIARDDKRKRGLTVFDRNGESLADVVKQA